MTHANAGQDSRWRRREMYVFSVCRRRLFITTIHTSEQILQWKSWEFSSVLIKPCRCDGLKPQKVWSRLILADGEKSLTEMKHREQTSAAELNANERLGCADLTVDDYLNHLGCCFGPLPPQIYRWEKQKRWDFWRREKKTNNYAVASRHSWVLAGFMRLG